MTTFPLAGTRQDFAYPASSVYQAGGPGFSSNASSQALISAMRGVQLFDISGSMSPEAVRQASDRANRYDRYLSIYNGTYRSSYLTMGNQLDRNPTRMLVNKRAAWACGKSFTVCAPTGNEELAQVFNNFWKSNGGQPFLRRSVRTLLTFGDLYWYFYPQTADSSGKTLPMSQWTLRVSCLHPRYVHPVWLADDPINMAGAIIQFPAYYRAKGEELPSMHLYTQMVTPDKFQIYTDGQLEDSGVNNLGVVPLVHMAHDTVADNHFGTSMIEGLHRFAEHYLSCGANIDSILGYHAEPTTVITGAKLSNMEKGTGKVWSGLPVDAKVETLRLNDDLTASFSIHKASQEALFREALVPQIALDPHLVSISNTSATALQLMFMPLIEASDDTQDILREGFQKAHYILARMHKVLFNEDLMLLADDPDAMFNTTVHFRSMVPRDRAADIDNAIKLVAAGIWSKAKAARELAEDDEDTTRLALEVAADNMEAMLKKANEQAAIKTLPLNYSAAFVNSFFLNEDQLDLVTKIGNLSADTAPGSASSEEDPATS